MGLIITTPYFSPVVGGSVADWGAWNGSLDGTNAALTNSIGEYPNVGDAVAIDDTRMLHSGVNGSFQPFVEVLTITGNAVASGTPTIVTSNSASSPQHRYSLTMLDASNALMMYEDAGGGEGMKVALLSIAGTVVTVEDTAIVNASSFKGSTESQNWIIIIT